jgi:hypothetical protein
MTPLPTLSPEAELDEKEAEYIRQVNAKEIDEETTTTLH